MHKNMPVTQPTGSLRAFALLITLPGILFFRLLT